MKVFPPTAVDMPMSAAAERGNAFDAGQGLTEHTSPFDAFVLVLSGTLPLTIGGAAVDATPGTIVRMPGAIPHAVQATESRRMLLK